MVPKALERHLAVFRAVREHLIDAGFNLEAWIDYPHALPEVPRPALFADGDFNGIDLGEETANFPHGLLVPPPLAYEALIEALQRDRATAVGRPTRNCWREFARDHRTSVASIMTPMRSGYYDIARPGLAPAYHVAEFAYLLSKAYPGEAELDISDRDFLVELDGEAYGIVNGEILMPDGTMWRPEIELEVDQLTQLRTSPGTVMPWLERMWRGMWAFIRYKEMDADADFVQAFAHCRWSLPGTTRFEDAPRAMRKGRPPILPNTPAREKALRVEEAYLLLRTAPHIEIRRIRNRLVPMVMSKQQWLDDLAPITRHKRAKRDEVVAYLKNLHEDLLQQAQ